MNLILIWAASIAWASVVGLSFNRFFPYEQQNWFGQAIWIVALLALVIGGNRVIDALAEKKNGSVS